jgi:hypothetical protein
MFVGFNIKFVSYVHPFSYVRWLCSSVYRPKFIRFDIKFVGSSLYLCSPAMFIPLVMFAGYVHRFTDLSSSGLILSSLVFG